MGAGGVIVPPATYFDRVQPILKKYDILFVVDEVICGFGRTGNMFGIADVRSASRTSSPSRRRCRRATCRSRRTSCRARCTTSCSRKATSSASSATATRIRRIRCPAAVALETLKIYAERDIVAHVRRVGAAHAGGHPQPCRSSADRRCARHRPHRRGRDRPRQGDEGRASTRRPASPRILVRRAQHHGVILRNMPGDIVAFCPPLIISEAEIDEMLARLRQGARRHVGDGAGKGPRVDAGTPASTDAAMTARRTAIVTGASRGIGHAIAMRFHATAGA